MSTPWIEKCLAYKDKHKNMTLKQAMQALGKKKAKSKAKPKKQRGGAMPTASAGKPKFYTQSVGADFQNARPTASRYGIYNSSDYKSSKPLGLRK